MIGIPFFPNYPLGQTLQGESLQPILESAVLLIRADCIDIR
jgi:hypothetical protein